MSFFRRNFADPEVVLRDAPGPIPWYWSVLPKLDDASWHEAGWDQLASGKFYLKNSSDEPIAILGMYCYAKAVDNDSFVVWYQRHDSGFSDSIDFIVLNLASLQAIDDVPRL